MIAKKIKTPYLRRAKILDTIATNEGENEYGIIMRYSDILSYKIKEAANSYVQRRSYLKAFVIFVKNMMVNNAYIKLIHSDLKPDNLSIIYDDESRSYVIEAIDLDDARVLKGDASISSGGAFTRAYLGPESSKSRLTSYDVYSVVWPQAIRVFIEVLLGSHEKRM